ncbi:NAD(P)/FAD-dependent oxidoreductase [Myxococcota bacterium]|nr:NAD(P)/FAD-dependent oxidoreductase [Myxococcota bacterium]
MERYDVAIIGGGPAGLSAALMLGRCRRRVVVLDDGLPRNRFARHTHGLLSRDGVAPAELRRIARDEVQRYGVELADVHVTRVRRTGAGFGVGLDDRPELVEARRILIASGLVDRLPELEGFTDLYGTSAFHCPYCDGWEVRDRPLAIVGRAKDGPKYALGLTTWSRDLVLFTNGDDAVPDDARRALAERGVALVTDAVARLEGTRGRLERVVLTSGRAIERAALFFHLGTERRWPFANALGLEMAPDGSVVFDAVTGETNVPGVFVAGDASKDVSFVSVAVSDGTRAAFVINRSLRLEDDPGLPEVLR